MMQGIVDLWIDKTSLSNTNKTPNETANNTNVVVGIFKGEIPTIILRVKGMLEKTARTLIWRYGLERLVAICEYVMGQTNLYNPVGFIRSELREDRLGLKDRPPRSEQLALELEDGERYVMGQFADFIYH
jgi:hypothetical protein